MKSSIAAVLLLVAFVHCAPRVKKSEENAAEEVIDKHLGYNIIPIYEIKSLPAVPKICSPHCDKELFEKPLHLLTKTPTSEKFNILYLAEGLKSFKPSDKIKLFQEIYQATGIIFTKNDFPSENYRNIAGLEPEMMEREKSIPYLMITNEELLKEINRDDNYGKVAEMEVSSEGLVTKINYMLRPTIMDDKNKSIPSGTVDQKNEAQQMNSLLLIPDQDKKLDKENKASKPENLATEDALYSLVRNGEESHLHKTSSNENNYSRNNINPSELLASSSQANPFTLLTDLLDLQNGQSSQYYSKDKLLESNTPFYPNNLPNIYPHSLYSDYNGGYSDSPLQYLPERSIDQKSIPQYPIPSLISQNLNKQPSPSESDHSQYYYNYPMTTEYSAPYGSYSQILGYPSSQTVPHKPQNPYTPRGPGSNTYKYQNHQHHYSTGSSIKPGYYNERINTKVPNYLMLIFSSVVNPTAMYIGSLNPTLRISQNDTKPFIQQLLSMFSTTNVSNAYVPSVVTEQPVSNQQNLTTDNGKRNSQLKSMNSIDSEKNKSVETANSPCKCPECVSKNSESQLGEGYNFGNIPPPFSIPAGYSSALQP